MASFSLRDTFTIEAGHWGRGRDSRQEWGVGGGDSDGSEGGPQKEAWGLACRALVKRAQLLGYRWGRPAASQEQGGESVGACALSESPGGYWATRT